jgi:hypothetical protein
MRLEGLQTDEMILDPWELGANTIRDELEERGAQRASRASVRLGIRDWIELVPEERGPLDLVKYAFQIEPLYSERAITDTEQVHVKATQIGWCLWPETRVLTADLRWLPIDDLEIGQELVAVDEESRPRALRRGVVEAKWDRCAPAFRLTMDDGTSIIATAEHRFLWKRCEKMPAWREVGRMQVGDHIRRLTTPWEPTSTEDAWLGGFIDGEGSLRSGKSNGGNEMVLVQQHGPVYDHAAAYLRTRGIVFHEAESPRPNGIVGRLITHGLSDLLTLVGQARPVRFVDSGWWEGRNLSAGGRAWSTIESIEALGERRMVDIQTSTKTFIAEGLVSHNSTGAIRQALYHADVLGRSVLYTFPTDDELMAFSRKRIRPVMRRSDHLRSRMTSDAVDNVGQKQIGQGWISFRGLSKPVDSIDVDVLIIDEYDTSDQGSIDATEYRLSGAESADIRRRIGVPSIPGFGIDSFWEASDQRLWTVRCEACNHHNPLKGFEAFSQNVDQDAVALVCAKCRKMIDVRTGEWVATYPDRPIRGYHAPKLLVPGRRVLARVIENSKKTRPSQVEAFHQRDLGEAYAPAEGRLSLDAIRACVRPDLRPEQSLVTFGLTTMGIDMASARALNVVIEDEVDRDTQTGRKVWVGTVEDEPGGMSAFQRLCWLMETFNVNMAGIDNEPDGRFSRAFAERFRGRVYRMDFFTPQPGARAESPVWNVKDEEQFVSLHRTKTYDATFERFRLQRVLLPPLEMLPAEYPVHLGNLYRRQVEVMQTERGKAGMRKVSTGKVRVDYVRTGDEDYAQAEAYNLAAIELFWRNEGVASIRGGGPRPLTDQIEDFVPSDLTSYDQDPDYRPGFQ